MPNMSLPETMKAVVFDGLYKISVQNRPVPKGKTLILTQTLAQLYRNIYIEHELNCIDLVRDDRDIIIKVHAAGLCGS